jgi:hypothetical protein
MKMGKNNGKGTRAARAGQLVAGARKRFPNLGQTLTFGGGAATVSVQAAIDELEKLVDLRAASTAARATARDTVKAERDQLPALVAFMNAFEALVRVTFGADTAALADFGLTPRKGRTPLTAEQKAVAAAKAEATREARGTKGPKARKAVRGNVTAELVVTPATPPAAAPKAPAPAPDAPAGGAAVNQPKG